MLAHVPGHTLIQGRKVDSMLERTVLDQLTLRDVAVVAYKTHGEAERDLGVGVELRGAKLDDVAHA